MKKVLLVVSGMKCDYCVKRVTKALMSVDGVEKVTVNLADGDMTVFFDDVSDEQLKEAVTDAGYDVVSLRDIEYVA